MVTIEVQIKILIRNSPDVVVIVVTAISCRRHSNLMIITEEEGKISGTKAE
jgi:hypothetical protein